MSAIKSILLDFPVDKYHEEDLNIKYINIIQYATGVQVTIENHTTLRQVH